MLNTGKVRGADRLERRGEIGERRGEIGLDLKHSVNCGVSND